MSSRIERVKGRTVEVEVRLVGILGGLLRKQKLRLGIGEPAVVGSVIAQISAKLGKGLKPALLAPGSEDPRSNLLVLLNGADVNLGRGLKTPLSDGDIITLIPLFHGG